MPEDNTLPELPDALSTPPAQPPAPPPVSAPVPPQMPSQSTSLAFAPTQDEKTLAIVMHVLGLVGLALIGPLVVWIIKKDQSAFLDAQGRELLNFQISMIIYSVACLLLCFVLIGFVLLPVIGVGALVLTIIGLVKASDGEIYRFPFILRFL